MVKHAGREAIEVVVGRLHAYADGVFVDFSVGEVRGAALAEVKTAQARSSDHPLGGFSSTSVGALSANSTLVGVLSPASSAIPRSETGSKAARKSCLEHHERCFALAIRDLPYRVGR